MTKFSRFRSVPIVMLLLGPLAFGQNDNQQPSQVSDSDDADHADCEAHGLVTWKPVQLEIAAASLVSVSPRDFCFFRYNAVDDFVDGQSLIALQTLFSENRVLRACIVPTGGVIQLHGDFGTHGTVVDLETALSYSSVPPRC